jgi:hypothetical protein
MVAIERVTYWINRSIWRRRWVMPGTGNRRSPCPRPGRAMPIEIARLKRLDDSPIGGHIARRDLF